jgi:heterotetrameric sarcosine oxidase gamma subunit
MTAISPLETIHKKGFFGDHHKKNEGDLVKISEEKNLHIIQIFQYSNSKLNTKNLQIDNLNLNLENSKVLSNKDTRILWSGPNIWLVISKNENILEIIKKNCNIENFAITDISHSRAIIQIEGTYSKEVLKKGCPINLNELSKNHCAGTVFHGINIVVDCIDSSSNKFNLITLRSFGESLYHHITDASLEYGYIGL